MPIFLSDLSVSDPADTEPVSNGANRIRQLTDAAKTTMDVEHTQTGEHQFPVAQPGTPIDGQIWFDLVNKIIRRYDGTDHTQLNTVGVTTSYDATLRAMTNTFVPIGVLSVDTFVNSRVLLLANYVASGTSVGDIQAKFLNGGTDVSSRFSYVNINATLDALTMVYFDIDTPVAGMQSYTLQAKYVTASGLFTGNVFLAALVF